MKTTCPHCSQQVEFDAGKPGSLDDGKSFACPSCSGNIAIHGEKTPARHALWRGLNRNLLILGGTTLLILGGLILFLATRDPGKVEITERKIIQKRVLNEYFQKLIGEGTASEKDLEEVAGIESFGGCLIGLSRDPLTLAESEVLAKRVGAEMLDLGQLGQARAQIASWLGSSFPDALGKTSWILSDGETMGIDSPDYGPVTTPERPRRAFLFWQGEMPTGWAWGIKARFDEALAFGDLPVARVRVGSGWGLIGKDGKDVLAPSYDAIAAFSEHGCARITRDGGVGLVDRNGKILAEPEWEDLQDHINGFIPVKKDGKWGYLSTAGKPAIPSEWDDAWRFSAEGFAVVTRDGKRGIIDGTGAIIVAPEWDGALNFCKEGIGALRRGGGWALVDTSGKMLTEPVWKIQWIDRRFDLGFIPVRSTVGWGCTLLGMDGRPLHGMGKDYIPIEAGVIVTGNDGESVVYGAGGKELNRFQGNAVPAGEGYLRVEKGNEFGFLDGKGKWVIPMRRGKARNITGGMVAVSTEGKWGFLDAAGKTMVREEWDEVRDFSEDRAAVRRGILWGFVDRGGKVIAGPLWELVGDFSCGRAAVSEASANATGVKPELITLAQQYRRGDRQARDRVRTLPRDQLAEFWAAYQHLDKRRSWSFIDTGGTIAIDLGENANSFYQEPKFTDNRLYVPGLGYINPQGQPGGLGSEAPSGTRISTEERPGDYHDRHGNSEGARSLLNALGTHLMAGVDPDADFGADLIPHAIPPKYGFMDAQGKVLAEPTWEEARVLSPEWVWIGQGGKCGVADASGRVVLEPEWDEVRPISPEWLWIRKGYHCGIADASGRIIAQPLWEKAEVLKVQTASVSEDNGRLELGPFGKEILSPWIRVRDSAGYKILQSDGKPAVPASLGDAQFMDFYGPKHVVVVGAGADGTALWSLYEPSTGSRTDFPDASRLLWNWSVSLSGLLWAEDKTTLRWKLVDATGRDLGHSQEARPDAWMFSDGMAPLQNEQGWFFVHEKGNRIGDGSWTNVRAASEGRAAVERDGKWGFIDSTGALVCASQWDEVRDFHHGRAAVRAGALWGYIDLEGNNAIIPVWDSAMDFESFGSHGKIPGSPPFALVGAFGKTALIGTNGALICDPKYEFVRVSRDERVIRATESTTNAQGQIERKNPLIRFGSDGRILIGVETRWSYSQEENGYALLRVDGTGEKPLTPYVWNNPFFPRGKDPFSGGLIHARSQDQRYGLLRDDGSEVVPPSFSLIGWVAPGVAAAWSETEGGLLDTEGNWLFKDNETIRISRFGRKNARTMQNQHRHGLVVIEDAPKWGYAKLTSNASR